MIFEKFYIDIIKDGKMIPCDVEIEEKKLEDNELYKFFNGLLSNDVKDFQNKTIPICAAETVLSDFVSFSN